jgi:hypothetical protein
MNYAFWFFLGITVGVVAGIVGAQFVRSEFNHDLANLRVELHQFNTFIAAQLGEISAKVNQRIQEAVKEAAKDGV